MFSTDSENHLDTSDTNKFISDVESYLAPHPKFTEEEIEVQLRDTQ